MILNTDGTCFLFCITLLVEFTSRVYSRNYLIISLKSNIKTTFSNILTGTRFLVNVIYRLSNHANFLDVILSNCSDLVFRIA